MASPDASAMEDKVRSLPEGLRTKHPGTWRVVDVSDWVKGWGESFVSAALAVKENGIDGDTIKMALEEASLGANAAKSDLQDSMGIMRGQSLRFNKEMKIFTDLYSYFETTTRPGVLPGPGGNTSTLPLDLANTDSSTIATTLIEGGVSRVDLAHQLLRADVPNATTQTRILGASTRQREDEGWLAEESKARQKSQKVKAGMSAAKKNKVGPAGSLEACFQRQRTANEVGSAAQASREVLSGVMYKGRKWTETDLLPAVFDPQFSFDDIDATAQFSHYAVLEVEEKAPYETIKAAFRQMVFATHPDRSAHEDAERDLASFHRVQEAWEVLRDPVARRRHDHELHQRRMATYLRRCPGRAEHEPTYEEKVRSLAKKLYKAFVHSRKGAANLKTRFAVATLGEQQNPETGQVYSHKKLAKLLQEWRAEVQTKKQEVKFETLRTAVREWCIQLHNGRFSGIDINDLMLDGSGRRRADRAFESSVKPAEFKCSDAVQALEEACSSFIDQCSHKKKVCTRTMILRRAYQFNPQMWGPVGLPDTMKKLKCWFQRFKNRCKFSYRTRTSVGQKLPRGWEGLWCGVVSRVLEMRRDPEILEAYSNVHPEFDGDILPLSCIYNSDQTPVMFETVETKTYTRRGVHTVSVATGGAEKDRVTFQLTASLTGQKIKPLAVFKGERLKIDPKTGLLKIAAKKSVANEIQNRHLFGYPAENKLALSYNGKAYVYEQELEIWAAQCLAFRKEGKTCPGIQILDDYACHKMMDEHLKKFFSLWISHIPGGLTPVAQMLDRSPNRMFKMVLRDKYNEWSLIQPEDARGKIAAPSRAQVARWGVEAWAEVTERMIVRASVLTGTARVIDFSAEDRQEYDLDSLKIDPIIVHLVTTQGPQWTDTAEESGADSNLRCRALEAVAQIMDLDLRKDSDKERAEKMLEQDKEDSYLGGGADMVALSEEQSMRKEIDAYYAWLDEGTQAYQEAKADVQEGGNSAGSSSVSKRAGAAAAGAEAGDAGAGAGDAAGETSGTAAGPAVGEKRKRTNFTATQKVYLAEALAKGNLDTGDKRQKVAELFAIERKVIDTWHRNNKSKKSKDGE